MRRDRLRPLQASSLLFLTLFAACQGAPPSTAPSLESRLRLLEAAETAGGGAGASSLLALRTAARASPRDAALQERLAVAAEATGNLPEAAQALRQATELGGATPERQLALGRVELRAGNTPAAIEAYRVARHLAPESVAAASALALAYDISRDHDSARMHHQAALARAPQDWGVRSNFGLSLVMAGRANEATALLGDAATVPDAPRRARHNLALALAAAGQRAEVVRVLRLDMPPAEAEALAREFGEFAMWLRTVGPDAAPIGVPVTPGAR